MPQVKLPRRGSLVSEIRQFPKPCRFAGLASLLYNDSWSLTCFVPGLCRGEDSEEEEEEDDTEAPEVAFIFSLPLGRFSISRSIESVLKL